MVLLGLSRCVVQYKSQPYFRGRLFSEYPGFGAIVLSGLIFPIFIFAKLSTKINELLAKNILYQLDLEPVLSLLLLKSKSRMSTFIFTCQVCLCTGICTST